MELLVEQVSGTISTSYDIVEPTEFWPTVADWELTRPCSGTGHLHLRIDSSGLFGLVRGPIYHRLPSGMDWLDNGS